MRKVLGGGMRQVGILAAACLFALSKAKENLTKDHIHAKKLAQGIADGLDDKTKRIISVNVQNTQTNIVHLTIEDRKLKTSDFIKRFEHV